jgi:hypothetical protein
LGNTRKGIHPTIKSSKKYFDVDAPVFWPSALLIVAFISITLIVGEPIGAKPETGTKKNNVRA